jgi:putative flippase GtrA
VIKRVTGARHWAGFIASGVLAFAVDAGVSWLLVHAATLPWSVSRLGGIAAAMVASFFAHRTLTFALPGRPTWTEFARHVGVAWTAAAVNWAVFVGLLWLWPALAPVLAIGIASLIAMAFSYVGLRFAVFRQVS